MADNKGKTAENKSATADNETTQPTSRGEGEEGGVVTAPADGAEHQPLPSGLPIACAREGETRKVTWERLRREGRGCGMSRKASVAYATRETDRLYPWVPPEPEPTPEPDPPPAADPPPGADPAPAGLVGLADLPPDWPELPPNAALAAEVQWVQASRLRVRSGDEVDLSRALSPAPSHASLAWLETAILFPAKWADIVAKATQHQADEREAVRRERLSIEEVRGLLAEMIEVEGGGATT